MKFAARLMSHGLYMGRPTICEAHEIRAVYGPARHLGGPDLGKKKVRPMCYRILEDAR